MLEFFKRWSYTKLINQTDKNETNKIEFKRWSYTKLINQTDKNETNKTEFNRWSYTKLINQTDKNETNKTKNKEYIVKNETKTDLANIQQNQLNENKSKSIEHAKKQIPLIFSEMIETEKKYIESLELIVNGFIYRMRNPNSSITMPKNLRGKENVLELLVFMNIEDIYNFHKFIFVDALTNCADPDDLYMTLTRQQKHFIMYSEYSKGKEISQYLIDRYTEYFAQIQKSLEVTINIADLLIKPVQRITRYKLFFDRLKQQCQIAELNSEAMVLNKCNHFMETICEHVNLSQYLIRINTAKYSDNILDQGLLLLRGDFNCIVDIKKKYNKLRWNINNQRIHSKKILHLQVYLFEKCILFAKADDNHAFYNYYVHIPINKMKLIDLPKLNFVLISTDNELIITCFASTMHMHHSWVRALKSIEQANLNFENKLLNPTA